MGVVSSREEDVDAVGGSTLGKFIVLYLAEEIVDILKGAVGVDVDAVVQGIGNIDIVVQVYIAFVDGALGTVHDDQRGGGLDPGIGREGKQNDTLQQRHNRDQNMRRLQHTALLELERFFLGNVFMLFIQL